MPRGLEQDTMDGVLVEPKTSESEVHSPQVRRLDYNGHIWTVVQTAGSNNVAISYVSGEGDLLQCRTPEDASKVLHFIVGASQDGGVPKEIVEQARADFKDSLR